MQIQGFLSPNNVKSARDCPEKEENVIHRNLIKPWRHFEFSQTQSNYSFSLKTGSDIVTKKANYLESLFGKFIKVQWIFNSSGTLENSDCLWCGWINETSVSTVPLGDTLSEGLSEYTAQHHLTLIQPDSVPDLSWYCSFSPSLPEAGINWKHKFCYKEIWKQLGEGG